MKYFISAGEASGDIHASQLIASLRRLDPDARFTFLGGDLMAEAAGCSPLIHYSDMAFMGFSEVIRHLGKVLGNLSTAKKHLLKTAPDALILVDYPSFNLKLAKTAHKAGIPVFYYISPKVWAWKERRVKKMKRYVKRILSILPFEEAFFMDRHGYKVDYVGNPTLKEVDMKKRELPDESRFRLANGIPPERPMLALVPGSRVGEIRNNLPIMVEVAKRHPELQPVIAGAPAIDRSLYAGYSDYPVVENVTFQLMALSTAALVTSGTATLECALLGTPQVVCYRANGKKFTYNLFKRILKVKYVSLPNLIADREVVAEQLLHLCNPDDVDTRLSSILPRPAANGSSPSGNSEEKAFDGREEKACDGREEMLRGYEEIRRRLTDRDAPDTAAAIIYNSHQTLGRSQSTDESLER